MYVDQRCVAWLQTGVVTEREVYNRLTGVYCLHQYLRIHAEEVPMREREDVGTYCTTRNKEALTPFRKETFQHQTLIFFSLLYILYLSGAS